MDFENIGMQIGGDHEVSPQGDGGFNEKHPFSDGNLADEDMLGANDPGLFQRAHELGDDTQNYLPPTQH